MVVIGGDRDCCMVKLVRGVGERDTLTRDRSPEGGRVRILSYMLRVAELSWGDS